MEDLIKFYENKLKYEIDSWDVSEALNNGEKLIVVDARAKSAYAIEHIPGAVSLPHREISAETTSNWDKDYLYVTYCDGIGCNASTKGALNLAKLGFRVKELMGGLDWWKKDGYKTEGEKNQKSKKIECDC